MYSFAHECVFFISKYHDLYPLDFISSTRVIYKSRLLRQQPYLALERLQHHLLTQSTSLHSNSHIPSDTPARLSAQTSRHRITQLFPRKVHQNQRLNTLVLPCISEHTLVLFRQKRKVSMHLSTAYIRQLGSSSLGGGLAYHNRIILPHLHHRSPKRQNRLWVVYLAFHVDPGVAIVDSHPGLAPRCESSMGRIIPL